MKTTGEYLNEFRKARNGNAAGMTQGEYEVFLRKQFPALQDAWNQYQTVLKLCESQVPQPKRKETAEDILAQIKARKAQLEI